MATTPEQRLEWARQHLQRLRAEVTQYLGRIRLPEDDHVSAIEGVTSLLAAIDPEPPAQIALIAGDAIHNLRAPLDNLMWELAPTAVRNRGANLPEFPIKATPEAFASTLDGVLAGFDPRLVDAVRTVQPFVGPPDGLPDDGGQLLLLLGAFWNDDKHRVPVVGFGLAGGAVRGNFQGSTAALARRTGIEVRFQTQRSSATVDDLDRIYTLLVDQVVPRLRAAA